MFVVLGATGHIGSAVVKELLKRGEAVTAVTRSKENASNLKTLGAEIAEVDLLDTDKLRETFRRGKRAFLLNPPGPIDGDPDAEELKTIAAILEALAGISLEKVVAESTMGAQNKEHAGDLGTLYQFEQGLKAQPIPAAIMRGAFYYTNWDSALQTAKSDGTITTISPVDQLMPMVDPADIGVYGARLLRGPVGQTGIFPVEGPERLSANHVAEVFSRLLGKPVKAVTTPPDQVQSSYRKLGFSEAAAKTFAGMAKASNEAEVPPLDQVHRGNTTIDEYLRRLIETPEA